MGLPLGLGGLERTASCPRDAGLLALLGILARLHRLTCRCTASSWGLGPSHRRLRASRPRLGLADGRYGLRHPCRWDIVTNEPTAVQATATIPAPTATTAAAPAGRDRPQSWGSRLLPSSDSLLNSSLIVKIMS